MRILIAGGTGFLGSACARQALAAGHHVSVLTRSGKNVATGAQAIVADRCGPLPDMQGQFDSVIDTKAYQPAMIDHLTDALGTPIPYVFASSISVYDALEQPDADETKPARVATPAEIAQAQELAPLDWCNLDKMGANYGPLKRSCEKRVIAWAKDQATCHRLDLICGPGDKTDRLTWWIRAADQTAALPLPGPVGRLCQIIDVEDAAAFMLLSAEHQNGGIFNVTSPAISLDDLLAMIVKATSREVPILPVPEDAIAKEGLVYWTDLPLIIPSDSPKRAMLAVLTDRAVSAGLKTRPVYDTLKRALNYDRQDRARALIAGLSPQQQTRLLSHHNPSG